MERREPGIVVEASLLDVGAGWIGAHAAPGSTPDELENPRRIEWERVDGDTEGRERVLDGVGDRSGGDDRTTFPYASEINIGVSFDLQVMDFDLGISMALGTRYVMNDPDRNWPSSSYAACSRSMPPIPWAIPPRI